MRNLSSLSRVVFTWAALQLLLLTYVAEAAQQISSVGKREQHPTVAAQQQQQRRNLKTDANTSPFEFHSGFWMNLHHFLYQQALLRKRAANTGQTPAEQGTTSATMLAQLPAAEQRVWDAALDYYGNSMVKRDLLFDEEMRTIKNRLAESERARNLKDSGLSGEHMKVLESAAPIYRARWWAEHDRTNQFWIAVLTPMLDQFRRTLMEQLSAAYKERWPAAPMRVDVVHYANWAGAYTSIETENKAHITIASADPDNQGFAALETIFHEASHLMVGPRDGAIADAIARQSRARNKPVPNGLWHAVLFYTVGEITRRNLSQYGVSNYKPYAYATGLYARGWTNYQKALELHWQSYLDGKVDFETAMARVIEAL